ncbi:MAG: hypothetical protein AB1498_00085 [bacterium]
MAGYSKDFSANSFKNDDSFFGGEDNKTKRETVLRFPVSSPEISVRDAMNGSPLVSDSKIVPIILPNTIHACRKKNLGK